jgi:hypothetical protein
VATTLTADQDEVVHFSFPIQKREDTATINPVDGTPDILITGKATDGTIDGDLEIVDPEWSAKAIREWCDTGGNVRMSHDPKRPVGKGQHVQVTTDGHYVTSLIADPLCKHFIRTGILNDYSVGISMPGFRQRDPRLDPQGKALRIITGRSDGLSRIAELSVVDRGSNFNSSFQIVRKSAGGGDELVGEMIGDEDEIAKAAPSGLLTKMAHDGFVNVDLPRDASISPADFAKLNTLKQQLTVKTAGADTTKRDVSATERRHAADEGHAVTNDDGHISYPIENAGDLENAARLARSGHGDVAAARKLIARRARELGVANPLDDDSTSKGTVTDTADKAAVTGALTALDQFATAASEEEAVAALEGVTAAVAPVAKAKKKKPKKMPPWMKPDDDDSGGGKDSGDDDACKGAHAWALFDTDSPAPGIRCEKCKTTPAEAAGLSGTHDMQAAPIPDLLESPPMASTKGSPAPQAAPDAAVAAQGQPETPARPEAGMMKSSPEVAAILRFKAAGIDVELGRLHDMVCPAYHPEDTAKCHPFTDLRHVDESYFQKAAIEAACGPSMERAKSLHLAWQAARVLKEADPGLLNDYRLDAHKAFRDANPGPSSALTPGMMTPGKFNRPLLTDGREASSTGHDGPNTSPAVATTAPNAHSFDRPPLEAGHQSPSPSHMKATFEYPAETGRPMRLDYAVMEKEKARQALMQMHEHLSRQFPEACPMSLDAPAAQPESRGVPATVGVGKSADAGHDCVGTAQALRTASPIPAVGVPVLVAASFKADAHDAAEFADAEVYKSFKKMRKKLGKRVLAGKMTVDEARTRMGRQFAQKGAEPAAATIPATYVMPGDPNLTPTQIKDLQDSLQKAAGEDAGRIIVLPPGSRIAGPASDTSPIHSVPATPDPGAIKSATPVTGELVSLSASNFGTDPEIIKAAVTEATSELKDLLVKQTETFTTKLAEQQRVINAIADQPDPSTAAFSGLAFNPARTKAARPAGVAAQAEIAERTQNMVIRSLQDKYNASSDPRAREAYYDSLCKIRGIGEQ